MLTRTICHHEKPFFYQITQTYLHLFYLTPTRPINYLQCHVTHVKVESDAHVTGHCDCRILMQRLDSIKHNYYYHDIITITLIFALILVFRFCRDRLCLMHWKSKQPFWGYAPTLFKFSQEEHRFVKACTPASMHGYLPL